MTKIMFVALILLMSTQSVFTYPPDNAALLYYQAFMIIERPDNTMRDMLDDLSKGKIKPDEKIEKYVENHRGVIELAVAAAEMPNCDWGLDYSKGLSLNIPYLEQCHTLAWVILADAQIFASKGDYKQALSRCLSVQKMGHHVSQGELMCYMIGAGIVKMADKRTRNVLGDMPEDLKTLRWFKNQLVETESRAFPFKTCVENELKKLSIYMKKGIAEKEFKPDFYAWAKEELPKPVAKFAKKAPEEFFARNEKYWNDYTVRLKAALELPYADGYTSLSQLYEQTQQDANNPNAAMTAFLASNWPAAFTIGTNTRTSSNAVRAAVDIYIIKATTWRLPDELPAGLPKDLFSGKDFEYERKDDSFVLRCRGKDLLRDKIHEYEFKVKK